MCLTKLTTKNPLIAKKNITVYKIVRENYFIIPELKNLLKNGNKCKAIIRGIDVNGKIFKDKNFIYIYHNNPNLNGSAYAKGKPNYKYSFIICSSIASLIVDKKEFMNIFYHTPYRNSIIEIGKEYTSELLLSKYYKDKSDIITKGLHSFIQKPNIKEGEYLVKCIIPKGSKYYKGCFDRDLDSLDSIASDKLKYIKILKK